MVVGLSVFKQEKRECSGAFVTRNRTSAYGAGAGIRETRKYNYDISGTACEQYSQRHSSLLATVSLLTVRVKYSANLTTRHICVLNKTIEEWDNGNYVIYIVVSFSAI